MKSKSNLILFIIFFINSCSLDTGNQVSRLLNEKTIDLSSNNIFVSSNEETEINSKKEVEILVQSKKQKKILNDNIPKYYIGEPYLIEGVQYIPQENYTYNKTGLATYYAKELHGKRTINNEFNKVTELFARHKTLPLPSVVKITNLENGLSLIVRVNDRSNNNSTIIEVSRKSAQLLRFFKAKLARVRVEILSDPSKQLKIVTQSMNDPNFNTTIQSAPTEIVTVTDLEETPYIESNSKSNFEDPIHLGFEEIFDNQLYIKISGFKSYEDTQKLTEILDKIHRKTIQKEVDNYSIIFGPMNNIDADKMFQILVTKGYNNLEIIIE